MSPVAARQSRTWVPAPLIGARLGSLSALDGRTVGVLASGILVATVAGLLLNWHFASRSTVIPFHDGSHHVANVASLVAAIRANGLTEYAAFARRSPSDALTYGVFGMASAVLGAGRPAFGLIWALCLVGLAAALGLHFRRTPGPALLVGLSLFLFAGLFQSQEGGARDTRVDLFAASLASCALLLLVNGRWFTGLVLVLAAAFAKGAAISLLAPLFVVMIPLGFLHIKRIRRPTFRDLAQIGVLAFLGWLFATRIGPQTVSYNLMATGGNTLEDRVRIFVTGALGYLQQDPWFYVGDLFNNYHGWIAVVPVALLVAGLVRRWPLNELRLGLFVLIALVYTWLLMTISPLHSIVLAIWFLPALTLLVAFSGGAIARRVAAPVSIVGALLLLAPTLSALATTPTFPRGTYAQPAAALFQQSSEMATVLENEFQGRSTRAVLLVNFLWADSPVVYNYDVFRVLIQEHLRKANVILDGWELGSFGKNWRPELDAQKSYPEIVMVIEQNPGGIDAGPAVRDFMFRFQAAHPECLLPIAQPIETTDHGLQYALRLTPTADCRDALFAAQP